jgi:glutamate/tyrosine decarboxylase-like PLP-dependent enzyme
MERELKIDSLRSRVSPLEMTPEEFRELGIQAVERIASYLGSLPDQRVNPGEGPAQVRTLLGQASLPERGSAPGGLLEQAADLLFNHSLFNGHPRFWGYITSSAAPIGALGDLLAAAVNPNAGGWDLSPIASEIEAQTVRWIADLIGYPTNCGGLLVSGGNMANFVGFLAARKAKVPWDVRELGLRAEGSSQLRVYVSSETHTWIQKAADQFGLGTQFIRWIPADSERRIDTHALTLQIREDKERGDLPFLVVGNAGTVSTGAIDPLIELRSICTEHDLWLHVDGAYGAAAAALPDASDDLKALSMADSVAIDPHKWLYSPLEAGCALVRDPMILRDTFSYHPTYYSFEQESEQPGLNYYEYGPQNSRGFRALKVWLGLRQVGREGYRRMISDDIRLAKALFEIAQDHPELEALTLSLSICTFRFVPVGLKTGSEKVEAYLNELNTELLARVQRGGEAYLSNAVIGGKYALRACVVNFRTSLEDIEELPKIVTRIGREVDAERRPAELGRLSS